MKHKVVGVFVLVAALLLAADSLPAHHGYATEFDAKNCLTLKGTLAGVDWENPHAYVYMDVKDASGNVHHWSLETISPNSMRRADTTREDFMSNSGKPAAARACPTKPGGTPDKGTIEVLVMSDGVPRILGQNIEGFTPDQMKALVPDLRP